MSDYDSTPDTMEHIRRVRYYLDDVIRELDERARDHDASKLFPPEKDGWDIATPKLKDLTYGTEEYRQSLRELRPTVEHHYAHNSHHPEFYPNGVDGMTLFDVVEMLCDWKAASERGKGNNFMEGLPYNKERFGLSDQLYSILENTAKAMGFEVPAQD